MSPAPLTHPSRHRARTAVLVLVVVAATTSACLLGGRAPAASSSEPPRSSETSTHSATHRATHRATAGALGVAGGGVPDRVTVFDRRYPAVTNLDAALLSALRRAETAARDDGLTVYVNSGWRSPAYQEQLLDDAVAQYGARAEAARWVATPTTSRHVMGEAVDVGRPDAASWLSRHGAGFGLCRVYRNEPWHFELRPEAVDHECPAPYRDPTRDPRLQR